jgi:hypothetical protein
MNIMKNILLKKVSPLAVAAMLLTSISSAPQANENSADLIMDHPNLAESAIEMIGEALHWSWDLLGKAASKIMPPTPLSTTASVSDEDKAELMKLLNIAGYKLKEIDTQVGIIPTVSFKFAMIRELSDADIDFLEASLTESKITNPGLYTEIQRTIVGTVMAINSGEDYLVSELKVQLLPLPKVAFSVGPKETALSEEGSTLMRAIQKMDRRVRILTRRVAAASAPGSGTGSATDLSIHNWMLGGALILLLGAVVIETRRYAKHFKIPALSATAYYTVSASGAMLAGYGVMTSQPLPLGCGILIFIMALGFAVQSQMSGVAVCDQPPAPKKKKIGSEPEQA